MPGTVTTPTSVGITPLHAEHISQRQNSDDDAVFDVHASPAARLQIGVSTAVKFNDDDTQGDDFIMIDSSPEFFVSDNRKSSRVFADTYGEASIQDSIFSNAFTRLVAALPSLTSNALNMARNAPQMFITLSDTLEKNKLSYADLMDPAKFFTPATIKGLVSTANELAGPGKADYLTAAFTKLSTLSVEDLAGVLKLADKENTTPFQRLLITGACLFVIAAQGVPESRYASTDPDSHSWLDKAILELSKLTLKELSSVWATATTTQTPLFSTFVLGGLFFWKVATSSVPDTRAFTEQIVNTVQSVFRGAQVLFQVAETISGVAMNNNKPQPLVEILA